MIITSLLTILALSACDVSTDNTYKTTDYNDPVFANNYYKIQEESITSRIKTVNAITLSKENNNVFTTYDELKAYGEEMDKDVANDAVTYDGVSHFNSKTSYGKEKCLGNVDDSFNHGILSKLTDGLMFCDGKTFQGVRVQIDQEGFIHEYEKACYYADYFAMSFKAGADYTNPNYASAATYKIKLNIKLYTEKDDNIVENVCSYTMENVVRDRYYLFGFKLAENMCLNLKGLGISYDLLDYNEGESVDTCLHLYETLFVNSVWY